MATRPVVPRATGEGSIGTDAKHWGAGYFDNLSLAGEDVAGTLSNMDLALAESTGYGIISGCAPTISGLTVTVGAGVVHLSDGTRKEISATSITLDAADSTNPRIDLVYIDSTGEVAKVTGTASASPSVPALPSGGISVCTVSVAANASTGTITDKRSMLPRWYNTGIVNVKDFGAVGDGVTDDTSAIQAAIDYAESLGVFNVNIIVPTICKVTSLYISNAGNDYSGAYPGVHRKQIIFCGGGGFYSEADFLFKRRNTIDILVGNLCFRDIIFESVSGNNFAVMEGYPFLRCKWINCTFRWVDNAILSDDFVQTCYFLHCTFVRGNGYIVDMNNGADIRFDDCLIEGRGNGVLKQTGNSQFGTFISMSNCCVEGIGAGDALFNIAYGHIILNNNYFELTPYIVKVEYSNNQKVLCVTFNDNHISNMNNGIVAATYFTCASNISINQKCVSWTFCNNSSSVPLINLDNIIVTDNSSGPRKFIKFRGNTTSSASGTYTKGSDSVITTGFVEFTGDFPFFIKEGTLLSYIFTDDLYSVRFSGISFMTVNGTIKIMQTVNVSLNANEQKIIYVTLNSKSPFGMIVDNLIRSTQILSVFYLDNSAEITIKNTSAQAVSGTLRLFCDERVPYFM